MNSIRIFAVLIASSFFAAHVTAAVILAQSPPESVSARTSDSAEPFGLNQQAQSIALGADANVAAVVVWGYYASLLTPTDSFTISFYTDAAGLPQEPPFQTQSMAPTLREATALPGPGGRIVYNYIQPFVDRAAYGIDNLLLVSA